LADDDGACKDKQKVADVTKKTIEKYRSLFKDFCSTYDEMLSVIDECEIFCSSDDIFSNRCFLIVNQCLYASEIVNGKAILGWHTSATKSLKDAQADPDASDIDE